MLTLPQWLVEVPLDSNSAQYTVFPAAVDPKDGKISSYGLSFEGYHELSGCVPRGQSGPAPLGFIAQSPFGPNDVQVTVGDKAYYYSQENSDSCASSEDGKLKITNAKSDFIELFKQLRASK